MQDFKHFDPKQAAMDEARGLLEAAARAAMADGSLPEKELPAFVVEVPNDVKNGDLASNFAMAGARVFGMPPRKIAEAVAAAMPALEETHFSRVEIAGPGFINLFLAPGWFADVVLAANAAGADYGRTSYGKGEKVNVEFVSANPTGPMHLGNARGGALGDCLAAAMDWAGYDVTREFLINDAGNQILKFGKSLAVRYLQIFRGEDAVSFPEDCYQGADIRVLAQKFADVHGDVYMEKPFEELQKDIAAFALPLNVQGLKDDMAKYRVHYDVWFSETTLHESGAIREMLDKLAERGATYEKDGAIWYRSMQYAEKYGGNKVTRKGLDGEVTDEDKDEVLVRANGVPTYLRRISLTTTTNSRCAASPAPSTYGAQTITATWPNERRHGRHRPGRRKAGHRADAVRAFDAGRPAGAHEQAHRKGHRAGGASGRGPHRLRPLPVQPAGAGQRNGL